MRLFACQENAENAARKAQNTALSSSHTVWCCLVARNSAEVRIQIYFCPGILRPQFFFRADSVKHKFFETQMTFSSLGVFYLEIGLRSKTSLKSVPELIEPLVRVKSFTNLELFLRSRNVSKSASNLSASLSNVLKNGNTHLHGRTGLFNAIT